MIRLPSLFKPYDAYVSCDPAIKQRPLEPADTATDDERKAYETALSEYIATLIACNDTGNWQPLLLEGQVPLKFVLQHIDRTTFYALVDRVTLPENNERFIGEASARALLVRLALVDIVGAEGLKIRREADPTFDGWVMAQPEVVAILDAADKRIIPELAAMIRRKATIDPKR